MNLAAMEQRRADSMGTADLASKLPPLPAPPVKVSIKT